MEEKTELKIEHIKPFLGTGLKAMYGNSPHIEHREVEIIGLVHRDWETHPTRILADNMDSEHIWMFKPLLHPLDRLTQPILEGGKIPIIELAKHSFSGISIPKINNYEISQNNNEVNLVYYKRQSTFFFSYSKKWKSFHWSRGDGERIFTFLQSELFEKLFEWHFDVFGLIPKGLALPIAPK